MTRMEDPDPPGTETGAVLKKDTASGLCMFWPLVGSEGKAPPEESFSCRPCWMPPSMDQVPS